MNTCLAFGFRYLSYCDKMNVYIISCVVQLKWSQMTNQFEHSNTQVTHTHTVHILISLLWVLDGNLCVICCCIGFLPHNMFIQWKHITIAAKGEIRALSKLFGDIESRYRFFFRIVAYSQCLYYLKHNL